MYDNWYVLELESKQTLRDLHRQAAEYRLAKQARKARSQALMRLRLRLGKAVNKQAAHPKRRANLA